MVCFRQSFNVLRSSGNCCRDRSLDSSFGWSWDAEASQSRHQCVRQAQNNIPQRPASSYNIIGLCNTQKMMNISQWRIHKHANHADKSTRKRISCLVITEPKVQALNASTTCTNTSKGNGRQLRQCIRQCNKRQQQTIHVRRQDNKQQTKTIIDLFRDV